MSTPTSLSLALLRAKGYRCHVVEKNMRIQREDQDDLVFKQDLLGILDILCFKGSQTLGVQTTSTSNVASRVKKIQCSPWLQDVRTAGWTIHVHGWDQGKPNGVRVIDMTAKAQSGEYVFPVLWNSILKAGVRSKRRPRHQVELPL